MFHWLWGKLIDWIIARDMIIVGPTDEWEDPAR